MITLDYEINIEGCGLSDGSEPVRTKEDGSEIHVRCGILLTKITATQNEIALSYHRVRRLYFLTVILFIVLSSRLLCS